MVPAITGVPPGSPVVAAAVGADAADDLGRPGERRAACSPGDRSLGPLSAQLAGRGRRAGRTGSPSGGRGRTTPVSRCDDERARHAAARGCARTRRGSCRAQPARSSARPPGWLSAEPPRRPGSACSPNSFVELGDLALGAGVDAVEDRRPQRHAVGVAGHHAGADAADAEAAVRPAAAEATHPRRERPRPPPDRSRRRARPSRGVAWTSRAPLARATIAPSARRAHALETGRPDVDPEERLAQSRRLRTRRSRRRAGGRRRAGLATWSPGTAWMWFAPKRDRISSGSASKRANACGQTYVDCRISRSFVSSSNCSSSPRSTCIR